MGRILDASVREGRRGGLKYFLMTEESDKAGRKWVALHEHGVARNGLHVAENAVADALRVGPLCFQHPSDPWTFQTWSSNIFSDC